MVHGASGFQVSGQGFWVLTTTLVPPEFHHILERKSQFHKTPPADKVD